MTRLFVLMSALAVLSSPAAGQSSDEAEKKLAKLEKRYEKELKRCREGDRRVCLRARTTQADIEELKRTLDTQRSQ